MSEESDYMGKWQDPASARATIMRMNMELEELEKQLFTANVMRDAAMSNMDEARKSRDFGTVAQEAMRQKILDNAAIITRYKEALEFCQGEAYRALAGIQGLPESLEQIEVHARTAITAIPHTTQEEPK